MSKNLSAFKREFVMGWIILFDLQINLKLINWKLREKK